MPTPPKMKLRDNALVRHYAKVKAEIEFLGGPSTQILSRIVESAEADRNADLVSSGQDLETLWRELLADAIHALKVRDQRERVWIETKGKVSTSKIANAREQNVYGITELRRYFRSFTDFERVLYGSEDVYRDHVTHVIRVWLIGVCLLTKFGSVDDLHLGFGGLDGTQIVDIERWAMWTIIALCHDLGYPLEKTHKINDVIDHMLAHFSNISMGRYRYSFQTQHQPLNEITLRLLSSKVSAACGEEGASRYRTVVQAKYHTKFAHSLEEFRHGIVSCLVLMKTLIYFEETDYDPDPAGALLLEDARQFHIRREMLRAIASHTCPDVYHLQTNTLAFLLIVCDELQEWGRPTFRDMKLGSVGSRADAEIEVQECDFHSGIFKAKVKYTGTGAPSADQVKAKFRTFHKLMRAAIEDETRKINFRWEIVSGPSTYVLEYDSGRGPFDELRYEQDGTEMTPQLYLNGA